MKETEDLPIKLGAISNLYKRYSIDDVLSSLFAISAYPKNVTSPIQHNFQYEALRGLSVESFQSQNKIKKYDNFKQFCEELDKLTPSFPTLEDYSPPIDWGNVNYFFDKYLFRLVWGVDGSTFDQISEYRLLYVDNDDKYLKRVGDSPRQELENLLRFHTNTVGAVEIDQSELPEFVSPGNFEVPSEKFWEVMKDIANDDYEAAYPYLVPKYTVDIKDLFDTKFDEKTFVNRLMTGSSIEGERLFIKVENSYYPFLLRYSAENVIKRWKRIFPEHHLADDFFENGTTARKDLVIGLAAYQENRFGKKNSYHLSVLLKEDGKPDKDVLVSLSFIENKVLAIVNASPSQDAKNMGKELSEIIPRIWSSLERFNQDNPKFYLPVDGKICELRAKHKESLEIQMLVVLPVQFIEPQPINLPKQENTTYLFLEDYLAIIDCCEDEKELLGFIEYQHSDKFFHTGMLDLFGSFKDSSGVLVAGADEPNIVVVTPSWGPAYRYKELKEFWELYPGVDILDDPRGWQIKKETDTRIRLVKKSMFHSLIYSKYGDTHFLQSSPFLFQPYEIGSVTNLLMESLEDTFSRIGDLLKDMPIFKYSSKIEVHFFPSTFLKNEKFKHLAHLDPGGEKWKVDSGRYSHIGVGVRLMYHHDLVTKQLQESNDNALELELAKEILVALDSVEPDEGSLQKCIKVVEGLKGKPRFTQYAVQKEASHPQHSKVLAPTERDYKQARKITALAAKKIGVSPGKYKGKKAQEIINAIIGALRSEIEKVMADFSFDESIEALVGYIDAEIAQYRYKRLGVIGSKEHDVDYERDKMLAKAKKEFLVNHRNNRYLLEKFTSLSPSGSKRLREDDIRLLMAIADEIIGAYSASDSINYDLYQPSLEVERDYQIGTSFPKKTMQQQDGYNRKQSQISLGTLGNASDRLENNDVVGFAEKLDDSFTSDFGFKLSSLLGVQRVLALWSEYTDYEDSEVYEVSKGEVIKVCVRNIKEIGDQEVEKIIDFLTLEPSKILKITDDKNLALDVPVWEHIKRPYRSSIRPLIKKGGAVVWGPYLVHMGLEFWSGVVHNTELPAKLDAPKTIEVLKAEHTSLDKRLEQKCIDISKRHTPYARSVKRKHVGFPQELGDYDCVVYIEESNTFVNIEAKNINTPKVTKDARRQIDKVFLREKNYVYRVEQREEYLAKHYEDFAKLFGLTLSAKPKVASVFVTTDIYFWTEYPPRKTNVQFMRVDVLDSYLKKLKKKK